MAKPIVAAKEVQQGRETVLLVEDEVTVLRLAREYLELQGYTVIDAGDPATAILISNAHAGPIHLLLTDVVMPGMTGRELANHLGPRRPEMRVLYMSGYTENAIGQNGTLDEGITLLQKPFTLLTLKAKVREVLDSPLPKEVSMSARLAMEVEAGRPVPKLSPYRAQRFKLQLPIKYRPLGENDWRAGTTENISRSGLLFRAEEMLPANIQLEINLVLPPEIAGLSAAEVVCRGEVVRTMEAEAPSMNPALAAKILQYHFQHGAHVPEA
jgi:CheY-like chemotaxis protein